MILLWQNLQKLFLYSKLVIKLDDAERLNVYMFYYSFVKALGLPEVFLLEEMSFF